MKKMMLGLSFFALATSAFASLESYYAPELVSQIQSGTSRNSDLKQKLSIASKKNHHALSYREARSNLFGKLDLKKNNQGFYLRDVYCHEEISGDQVGEMKIPGAEVINCEHTWPQSKFSSKDTNFKVADLHHLFVAGSKVNSVRGNYPFGNVNGQAPIKGCDISSIGKTGHGIAFSPPAEHRGDAARAMFYFATRYDMSIDEIQEKDLRQWSKDDPVDEEEKSRNDMIEKIQGNRNPFVDFADAIDEIANF